MVFRVRLDNLDYYSAPPTELDPALPAISRDVTPLVPVLRIFGAKENGERVCAHIHGVLPYLYVEYPGAYVAPEQFNLETAQAEVRKLRRSIDRALNARYSRWGFKNKTNQKESKKIRQYVATIALVKGVPFYGYNVGWKLYCKIYLHNPRYISGLMDVLANGGVTGKPMQPFEGHINYTMQFLIDFNLYGCGFVEVAEERVKYRRVCKHGEDEGEGTYQWESQDTADSKGAYNTLPEDRFPRHSYHGWEVDIRAADILNRYQIEERKIHQEFSTEPNDTSSPGFKHLHSLDELWRAHGKQTQTDNESWSVPPSTARDGAKQQLWVEERDYSDKIREYVQHEIRSLHGRKVTHGNILRKIPYEDFIPTAFESVDYVSSFDIVPPRRPTEGKQASGEIDVQEKAAWERAETVEMADAQMGGTAGVGTESDDDFGLDEIDFAAIPPETFGDLRRRAEQQEAKCRASEQSHTGQDLSPPNASGELRTEILTQARKRKAVENSDSSPLLSVDFQSSYEPTQVYGSDRPGLRQAFDIRGTHPILHYSKHPPTLSEIQKAEPKLGFLYTDSFYGKRADVPRNKYLYGQKKFEIKSHDPIHLPAFDPDMADEYNEPCKWPRVKWPKEKIRSTKETIWMYALGAPTLEEVSKWESDMLLKSRKSHNDRSREQLLSQIEGPTQKNGNRFVYTSGRRDNRPEPLQKASGMCAMSLEIHVNTTGGLVPDPRVNPISCIFWCAQPGGHRKTRSGMLAAGEGFTEDVFRRFADVEICVESNEMYMLNSLVDIVRDLDPDILTGYEIHSSSWGYVIERAKHLEGLDLINEFSRAKLYTSGRAGNDVDLYNVSHQGVIKITGRHTINIWRAMKGELRLLGYNMENVVFHLLNRRIPHYAFKDLTTWFQGRDMVLVRKVVKYFLVRVNLDLEILEKQEFVTKISEHARLIGIDFQSVFNRGSQHKVESLMFRIAKPESYILISPSRKQVSSQNALECTALNMEPDSRFYNNPVVVLDFQSLYPSIMIAYNYCYSTCLGRTVRKGAPNKLGFTEYRRPLGLLGLHEDNINVSPNGMMFVKPHVRQSLLAKMLSEILDTRVMVKDRMKRDKDDKDLQHKLNSWQLALKLTANVTYGYTSASFSGRMPCSEIADSIVQSGRETLEKAINLINNERWGAKVVYGDTDSLFVELPGKSKDEAFDIGYEIAERVTAMNPKPIKLKFEKVYLPSVMLMKKRYVGLKYEYRDQKEPDFDAKGIETVRRDYFPAIQKMQETALKIHFRTLDLSQVKEYCLRQWTKMMQGRVSIQDFCIAQEVKLPNWSEGAPLLPHVAIAKRRREADHRNEPQFGERIPYVIAAGGLEHHRISDRAVEVHTFLHSSHLMLDIDYYIQNKMIPPLSRIFNVIGAPIALWYKEMPKYRRPRMFRNDEKRKTITLDGWIIRDDKVCYLCRAKTHSSSKKLCSSCSDNRDASIYKTFMQLSAAEKWMLDIRTICFSCSGASRPEELKCDSLDCPVFYSRVKETQKYEYQYERAREVLRALRAL